MLKGVKSSQSYTSQLENVIGSGISQNASNIGNQHPQFGGSEARQQPLPLFRGMTEPNHLHEQRQTAITCPSNNESMMIEQSFISSQPAAAAMVA